ncbi:MAG TPA: NrfD/PsrC family molybdoenzyme membrane anchor subunit [Pyrinomonadaceae bacterium]|nr:NrfD/PsrC family molybdoenzyme membrane anchor subunit [Pyrinomonadaceae bacterium]
MAHSIPWDWRVSLYTWTKGIASGVYLVAALLVLLGFIKPESPLWLWATPIVSGAFLGITGLLLLWDLEHPSRFYMIFTRPQWRSWLVKGAFIIAGYSLVLAAHFVGSIIGSSSIQSWLMIAGIPLALLSAVYTAYLFAQAKARDLWQNPLLPPHLLVQALLLGSAVLLPLTLVSFDGSPADIFNKAFPAALWMLTGASLIHLLLILGELSLTHATAHARVAMWEMTRGRYRTPFWTGIALAVAGGALPLAAFFGFLSIGMAGVLLAIAGVIFSEHAYVQAGQSVPLA